MKMIKKKVDISVKIKDFYDFLENNDETNKNYFRDSNQKLNEIINDKNSNLTDSRIKSSENGVDSSRYIQQNFQVFLKIVIKKEILIKTFINMDKLKRIS